MDRLFRKFKSKRDICENFQKIKENPLFTKNGVLLPRFRTISCIFSKDTTRGKLQIKLTERYAQENYEFIEQCIRITNETTEENQIEAIMDIYETFIKKDSPKEINISHTLREKSFNSIEMVNTLSFFTKKDFDQIFETMTCCLGETTKLIKSNIDIYDI